MSEKSGVPVDPLRFSESDFGCYADGALGWRHVRRVLADLVRPHDTELACRLEGEVSCDASEEDEALDLLNSPQCSEGGYWYFEDGNLIFAKDDYHA